MSLVDFGSRGVIDIPDHYLGLPPAPVPPPTTEPSAGDYVKSLTGDFIRGVTENTAQTAEGIAGFQRNWLPWSPEISNKALESIGGVIRSTGEAIAPAPVPALQDKWYSELAGGLGSTVPFIAGGLAARAAKLPAWLAASLAGSGAGAKQVYDDAVSHGASEEQAKWSLLYGGITGASEGLGAGRILDRIDKASGGSLWKFLLRVGGDTAEEALQNAGQQLAQDVGAKNIFGYDKDRELLPDFLKAAALGGGVGLIASTLLNALGIPLNRAQERSNMRRGEERRRTVIREGVETGELLPETKGTYADQGRTIPAPTSQQAPGVVQETEEQVRLRGAQEAGVATSPGTVAPPTINSPQIDTSLIVPPTQLQSPPAATLGNDPTYRTYTPVPAPQAVANGIAAGTTVRIALSGIAADKTNPYSDLAGELVANGDEIGLSVPVLSKAGIARSSYFYGTDESNPERIEMATDHSSDARAIIHETIHALTAAKIRPLKGSQPKELDAIVAIGMEAAKKLGYFETLKKVGSNEAGLSAAGVPYGFNSPDEFLAEAFTNPAFQEMLRGIPSTKRGQNLWQAFVDAVRRILGIPQGRETLLDEVIREGAKLISQARGDESKTRNPTAPLGTSPAAFHVPGAIAQAGQVAKSIYEQREQANRELDGLAYERQQFKAAKSKLKELADLAYGRLIASGDDESIAAPDPMAGVSIENGSIVVAPEFSNTLSVTDVQHEPSQVQAMQAEIFFEQAAKRLINITADIDGLRNAVSYYQALGVEQPEIDKIGRTIATLTTEANTLGAAALDNRTVGQRAGEVRNAEAQRQSRLARRDALSLDPVSEWFGPQVGGIRIWEARVGDAVKLAEALRDQATTPEEQVRLATEVAGWLNLTTDVRRALLGGGALTDEEKSAAFAALNTVFLDFDRFKAEMAVLQTNRTAKITKDSTDLLDKIADAKIKSGMAEVMVADVLAALDGESGGTGTLQSQTNAQLLKGRFSAITTFAKNLGENLDSNQALFRWLVNPTGPSISANAAAFNIGPVELRMILAEVQRNPAFGSAIVTLVQSSNRKLAKLPIVQLEKIRSLLAEGKAAEAKTLAAKIMERSNASASIAESTQRENLKKLDALEIEQQSLIEGSAMFNELADSPDFKALRNAVENSPYGLVKPMILENNTSTTFLPFGGKGLPSDSGAVLTVADDVLFKSEARNKEARWYGAAQQYLLAYEAALKANADNPESPTPAALGFDLPTVRGLKDAVYRYAFPRYLDLSLMEENKRFKIPTTVRQLNKLAMFRQHTMVTRMVGGQAGMALRGSFNDYVNYDLVAKSINHNYRDLADKKYEAIMSHPEVKQNLAEYRKIWNEICHEGRRFGSPLRVGYVLPRSRAVVTAEDLALLKREHQHEEDLRRRVAEATPVSGIRVKYEEQEFVRSAASVGTYGLPRHINRFSDDFIADVRRSYREPKQDGTYEVRSFTPLSDISITSSDPLVAYWNRNVDILIGHVLDIGRDDRMMRIGGLMRQAEANADIKWRVDGRPEMMSLEDVVNQLVANFPSSPGMNVRDHVINGLNSELRQYYQAANRIFDDRAERDQARNTRPTIALSADNEFTKPAAQLELPGKFYDYGALTSGEHLGTAERANHERALAYFMAVERAIGDLKARERAYSSGSINDKQLAVASYGGSISELQQVLGILEQIATDLKAAQMVRNPTRGVRGVISDIYNTFVASVLALPVVNLRNLTQGQFEVYIMARAMGLAGHKLTMWRAAKNMVKAVSRYALHVGLGVVKRLDIGASVITQSNVKFFENMVNRISETIFEPDTRSERVRALGFDTRESFLDRTRHIIQETAIYADEAEAERASVTLGKRRKAGSVARAPIQILRAAFERLGVQESDLIINASNLAFTHMLEKRMEQVAQVYGRAREGLGMFDLSDSRWLLQPHEWASFNSKQENTDSLGMIRLLFEGAAAEGFQLERALWEHYEATKNGRPHRFFTERQFDSVQRSMLAEFNASTPGNRASAVPGNSVLRALLKLHGYPADGMLKLFNVFGGARDRSATAALMVTTPLLAMLAFMAVIIGYFVSALTGLFDRVVQGRVTAKPTPLDADFYSSFKRAALGTLRVGSAQLFYVGELILWMRGEVQGNRGFDPAGRVFGVSVANRAYSAIVGAFSTKSAAPIADFTRSFTPWYAAVENLVNHEAVTMKRGERLIRGEADDAGLLPSRRSAGLGPSYGPTTIIRRNIGEAVSEYWNALQSGDTTRADAAYRRAQEEMGRLREFYLEKYAGDPESYKKAEADIWRDYQELNPAVAGMMGKRPTAGEWQLIHGKMSGARLKMVDDSIAAWQTGAMALFGRQGQVTREDVAAGRSGGGGGGSFAGIPSVFGGMARSESAFPATSVFSATRRSYAGSPMRRGTRGRGRRLLRTSRRFRQPKLAGRSRRISRTRTYA